MLHVLWFHTHVLVHWYMYMYMYTQYVNNSQEYQPSHVLIVFTGVIIRACSYIMYMFAMVSMYLQTADPQTAQKIDEFIEKLQECLALKRQFTLVRAHQCTFAWSTCNYFFKIKNLELLLSQCGGVIIHCMYSMLVFSPPQGSG